MESDDCVFCCRTVRPRQEAIACDRCQKWQHRTCSTNVTRDDYRLMVKGSLDLQFICVRCSPVDQPAILPVDQPEPPVDQPEPPIDQPESPVDQPAILPVDQPAILPVDVPEPDQSFDIADSFAVPKPIEEDSLNLSAPLDLSADEDGAITYQEVAQGTSRGKRKLVDSQGFSYTMKKQTDNTTSWRCSKRQKGNNCPATVLQRGEVFQEGRKHHTHDPQPGIATSIQIQAEIRSKATTDVFTVSAPRAVERLLQERTSPSQPTNSRPNPANLIRTFNRLRQSQRPKEPEDMNFEIDDNFLSSSCPGFLKKDITVDGQRHLVFSSDRQIELLSRAKTWYMDGTFRVVNKPFTQLFSIHAFVKTNDNMKQLPLVFGFMSKRRRVDYYAVLRAVDRMLPDEIKLQNFVVDFEIGLWLALQERFPDTPIQGCAFHWNQAVFRKVQELGLQTAYNQKDDAYTFLRQVMALPFLPPEHIRPAFDRLDAQATSAAVQNLMDYVYNTWMINRVFKIECWSVFQTAIRTNNDVEGWHNRLNSRVATRGPVPFYLLLQELFRDV